MKLECLKLNEGRIKWRYLMLAHLLRYDGDMMGETWMIFWRIEWRYLMLEHLLRYDGSMMGNTWMFFGG